MSTIATWLETAIQNLRQRRYPTLLMLEGETPRMSGEAWEEACRRSSIQLIDYREDVLAKDASIVLGAYTWGEFLRWLRTRASASGGVLLVNGDALVSTWDSAERKAFYREFIKTECSVLEDSTVRAPIVLVSHLARTYAHPSDITGQGIVKDIEEILGESTQP